MNNILLILIILFNALYFNYLLIKIVKRKYHFLQIITHIFLLILTTFLIHNTDIELIKAIFYVLIITFLNKSIYKLKMKESLISTFIIMFNFFVSELIFTIFIKIFSNFEINYFINNLYGRSFANIFMVLISLLTIDYFLSIYNKIIKIKFILNDLIFFFSFLFIINLILSSFLYEYPNYYEMTIYISFILITIFLLFAINIKKTFQYNDIKEAVYLYEDLYKKERIFNHECLNNKKLLKISEDIYENKTLKIGKSYLGETINSKKEIAIKRGLNFKLDIEHSFFMKNYYDLSDKNKIVLSKIVAIYLDNSIKYASKNILINLYQNIDYIFIEIINDFNYYQEKNDIKHVYGLKISKLIIKNTDFDIDTKVIGNNFIQKIKIKM